MKTEAMPWVGFRIVPLVVIDKPADVVPVMDALLAGSIGVIEIGLRTPAAMEAIEIAVNQNKMVVAAGTIRTPQQVHDCLAAGVSFGISPSSTKSMMSEALDEGLPLIPAIASLTEAQIALDMGYTDLKTYPTDLLGGTKFLRAIGAVMNEVRLMPAGGVTEENLASFLAEPNCFGVSGSWIAHRDLIAAGDFSEITKRAAKAMQIANSNG